MRKEDKQSIIEQLGAKLNEYAHFYLVDVTGLNAEATSSLRRKCFGADIKMVVVKNTLLHKAFEAAEIDYSPLYDVLKGSTAVFFCNTANAPAKLIKEVGKNGVPALKVLMPKKVSMSVQTSSIPSALSRAKTKSLQKLWPCCSRLQRTLSLLSSRLDKLSTAC